MTGPSEEIEDEEEERPSAKVQRPKK
jgi:hypothetical protein